MLTACQHSVNIYILDSMVCTAWYYQLSHATMPFFSGRIYNSTVGGVCQPVKTRKSQFAPGGCKNGMHPDPVGGVNRKQRARGGGTRAAAIKSRSRQQNKRGAAHKNEMRSTENEKQLPNRPLSVIIICSIVKEVRCVASKKDNLPTNVDFDLENGGTIKYANEVIAIIAGVAASEVDGIAGMATSGGISLGRKSGMTRGIKVEVAGEDVGVEIYIVVEYGSPIQKVASEVQENVRKAIETMTGLHVVKVDVHVQGVSFEKEKKALQTGLESAHLTSEENERIQSEVRQVIREEKRAEEENGAAEEKAEEDSATE